MAKRTIPFLTVVFFGFALLAAASILYFQCRRVVSYAHSLMTGVAKLRASRGDLSGSERAQFIGKKLDRGLELGLWRSMWLVGRDYAKNFAWNDTLVVYDAISDITEIMRCLGGLSQMNSGVEMIVWLQKNYQNVINISKSFFTRILKVLYKSEKLRKVVDSVEIEIAEGRLLRDLLELWSNDLIHDAASENRVMSTNSEEPEVIDDPYDSKEVEL